MILSFLQRARQRFLWNEVIAQFALGGALLMGGAVLLLLTGTGILDWRVVVALCMISLGVAIYRTIKRVPSEYKIAVLVDSHAKLHDALSTAYFFSDPNQASKVSTSVQEAQRSHAEALLPSVDLESAIPFRLPRALYAMGTLFLVASGLFAVRYGTAKKLDWRAPISQLIIESLGLKDPEAKQLAANTKKKGQDAAGDPLDTSGNPIPKSEDKKEDPPPSNAADSVADSQADDKSQSAAKSGDNKGEQGDKAGEEGDSDKAEGAPPQNGKNVADNPSGSQDGPQQGEQSGGKQQDSNQSSLLSKMKDAMSNLLSKAKPQAGQQPTGKKDSGSKGQQQQKAQSTQQSGEKGSQQNQQGESQEASDSQQGEQPGDSDNQQDSQGKGSGKNSDKQASAQPGSGIGKQDGAKEIAAAQQQTAMGKLSEIIGKRSANVSGEMMLDVQSGPQQLRTQYSKSGATHAAAAGEISRDEVPVSLQGYVQQYFDEVRKGERTAGPAPAKVKDPAPGPTKP